MSPPATKTTAFVAAAAVWPQVGYGGCRSRPPVVLPRRARWADLPGGWRTAHRATRVGLPSAAGRHPLPPLPPPGELPTARPPSPACRKDAAAAAAEPSILSGQPPPPAGLASTPTSVRAGQVWYPAPRSGRLIAIGDVHGDVSALVAALLAGGLLTEDGHWGGGDAVLVQTGDVLDRWGEEREALSLLFRLQDEARAQGGAVHLLAGNHELECVASNPLTYAGRALNFKQPMSSALPGWPAWDEDGLWSAVDAHASSWLTTRRRELERKDAIWSRMELAYISGESKTAQEKAYRLAAFSVGSPLRAQLLERLQAIIVVGDVVFVHAHVSVEMLDAAAKAAAATAAAAAAAMNGKVDVCGTEDGQGNTASPLPQHPKTTSTSGAGATALNRALHDTLRGQKPDPHLYRLLDDALWQRVWSVPRGGRGDPGGVLDALSASALVVGHTPQERGITARHGGRVWCVDTAMSRGMFQGGVPEVVEFRYDDTGKLASPGGVRVLAGLGSRTDDGPGGAAAHVVDLNSRVVCDQD